MLSRLEIEGLNWGDRPREAVLVPVKAFADAKVRLAPALPPEQRALLAREMGRRVLLAAQPLPVAVVCDDPEVASWARSMGARVIWEPGRGLNRAVTAGVARLAAEGVARVIVAHADLLFAAGLAEIGRGHQDLAGSAKVILVPDRHLDGTNVACVPTGVGFGFSYGSGSFQRHRKEALRLGLEVEVLDRPDLAWDIDQPHDLADIPQDLASIADLSHGLAHDLADLADLAHGLAHGTPS